MDLSFPDQYGFTESEWEACLKVLGTLRNDPFRNPDNETLAALIMKIHKQARKANRKESYTEKKEQDRAIVRATTIVQEALAGSTQYTEGEQTEQHTFAEVRVPRNCYCCNASYKEVHFFYSRLCPTCALENYHMRYRSPDLKGRTVILTGGRVKVGYATALKILRCGATLVLTSRFPALALEQLHREPDFETWKDRLTVYGLDLRNLNAIRDFIAFYKEQFSSLDILINNAAQTIKYTDEYYTPLIRKEQQLLENNVFKQLTGNQTPVAQAVKELAYEPEAYTPVPVNRFGQPVDFREQNSWNAALEDVSTYELIEVNLINHIAPYILIKELKPLMKASAYPEKFIINVTSSEGMFAYENKSIFHPHTNMTKAALNMLTRTSAAGFTKEGIYMSAVDVGWVSTGAIESLRSRQFEQDYIPPLDSVDAAARIMHPIDEGINKKYYFGVLLKNYKISDW